MAERVRVVRHDGRLLAAKEPGPAGADALRAEAALLDRARVPGVVELVGVRAGEAPLLLTAWVGPRSLAEVPRPLDPDHAAALCLAVAGTVQRLHRCGITHGAVEASHVLLDDHGRPVLCGFGHAGSIGAPVRRPATGHPVPLAADDATRHAPADDVAGLGRLLADLLGPTPPRGLRPSERRRAAAWRALRGLAEQARAEQPEARPSLASLSRSIRRAAPGAALPGDPGIAPASDTDARVGASHPGVTRGPAASRPRAEVTGTTGRRRSPAPLLAAAAVLLVGTTTYLGLSSLWSSGPHQRAGAAAVRTDGPASSSSLAPISTTTSSRPTTTTAAPTTTTTTAAATSTTTGAGAVGSAPGGSPVVVHDGRRYAIGAPGDVVVVGPWRCDGIDLPAVLRTGDGTVSVFDAWVAPGGQATARAVATLAGASGLVAVADGPGCAVLAVTGPAGPLATLTRDDLT
jgi:hypothetical protein